MNQNPFVQIEAVAQGWNPDQACEEMAELFNQADEITSQPHYQDVASADRPDISSADSSQTTEEQQS